MKKRVFIDQDFEVTDWSSLKKWFEALESREISSLKSLEQFLFDRAELEAIIGDAFAWAYIDMNLDTTDKKASEKFINFVENIQPELTKYDFILNKKIVQNEHFSDLPDEPYFTYKRTLKASLEIYRDENVPLFTEIEKQAQEFGAISGAMTIEHDGKELTIPQAGLRLQETDREERELVFKKLSDRRALDREKLDVLMDELIAKRHKVAINADFSNFRDFSFKAKGRFDYTPDDCKNFHKSVAEVITPLIKKIHQHRAQKLGFDKLRPWDLSVDIDQKPPLRPFKTGAELLAKTKTCFGRLDPDFRAVLETMEQHDRFDLESKKGKAPGGFQYPLNESGIPFIYMNAAGSHQDVETLLHEGGHALHSLATLEIPFIPLRSTPHEVSELASMAMELISMETWDEFYTPEEVERAKQEKLEDALMTLPGVAKGDAFQHWLYENPNHSSKERSQTWSDISRDFETGLIDWSGFETDQAYRWQQVLHFYEVPFYYIEYGFAQLGSIALWKNYCENPKTGLEGYKNFMRYGYTKTLPELYEAAGIEFNFSSEYIQTLADFVEARLKFD